MSAIEVGVYLPQVALTFDEVLARARRVEQLGFGSLWLFDHLYTPMLPDRPALEGWTLATALLARTSTLRVGHLVLDDNLRHPALLAQMVATADVVSEGRFLFGLGSGSYEPEHHEAGIPWPTLSERSARLDESLTIVRGLLEHGRFTFTGQHHQVRDLPCLPLPVQRPHPPVHLGGVNARHTLPVVARHADVWNVPTSGLHRRGEASAALDRACEAIDRDPATIVRSLQVVVGVGEDAVAVDRLREIAARRFPGPGFNVAEAGLVGTPAEVAERLLALAAEGFTSFVVLPVDRAETDVLDLLAADVLSALRSASGP